MSTTTRRRTPSTSSPSPPPELWSPAVMASDGHCRASSHHLHHRLSRRSRARGAWWGVCCAAKGAEARLGTRAAGPGGPGRPEKRTRRREAPGDDDARGNGPPNPLAGRHLSRIPIRRVQPCLLAVNARSLRQARGRPFLGGMGDALGARAVVGCELEAQAAAAAAAAAALRSDEFCRGRGGGATRLRVRGGAARCPVVPAGRVRYYHPGTHSPGPCSALLVYPPE